MYICMYIVEKYKTNKHFCVCSKPGHRFPMPYVEGFFLGGGVVLRVVRFVDIGKIVDTLDLFSE